MIESVMALILSIPLYAIFIWTYFNPEDSLLWGERWKYREEPELSDEAIKSMKVRSIVGLVVVTLCLGVWFVTLF